ncbi:putative DNA N6-adenine methyltransferase [Hokovirus HKV1]|uniref:site-specific DNA-methyltransferase (adenine-specific) n=1 Tax=Hokovirus HKV1 TaxID=1977638 RepID=A0A1V0SEU4_9VIRU|nr:putative DNA N6-adenine methyltransferase [Hokovirus HKV1]
MDNTFFVTNDDLKSYIHNIHNFLRNNGVGYGMTSLNCFNVFYGLKLIQKHLDKLNLDPEEKNILDFNNLINIINTGEGEITSYIDNQVLDTLFEMKKNYVYHPEKNNKNRHLADFLFHQIPRDVSDDVWVELITKIDKLPIGYDDTKKVNLAGKIYEYFIGRDHNAISELGAFFTDRHIVDFIYDKIKPELNKDNTIKTMIDPFGGSGGFTLNYAYYLRNNYKNIDWLKNNDKIFHFDMQKDVVNMTGIEMFAITGVMPNRDYNYKRINSFNYEFTIKNIKQYYDYVISNPPYGGDKYIKTAEHIKKELIITELKKNIKKLESDKTEQNIKKIKIQKEQITTINKELDNYIKIQNTQMINYNTCSKRIKEFCSKHNIDPKYVNDKEAASLILLVDLLAENGIAALVLKEGVFFDNKYSKLREIVTKNYDITNIISVPANAFENTTTKTSIIILCNNGPTENITFSELIVETEQENIFIEDKEGRIGLEKYKGEISNVYEKILCNASFESLSKGTSVSSKGKNKETNTRYDWSWNYKNYNISTHFVFKDGDIINMPKNYKLVKFGDIFKFKPKTKHQASKENPTGKYRFYTSGNTVKYCNFTDINDPENNYLIFGNVGNGSLFIDNCFAYSYNNIVSYSDNKIYTYYFYLYIKFFWEEYVKHLYNGSIIGSIQKENLLNMQIPIPEDIKTIETQILELKQLHDEITKNTESIPEKEKEICGLIEKLTSEGKEGIDYDVYRLGDICKLQDGYDFYRHEMDDPISKPNINYPLLKINSDENKDYVMINSKYDKYIVKKNDIVIGTKGTCGLVRRVKIDTGYHKHGLLKITDIQDIINNEYLYYIIKNTFNDNFIKNNTNASVLSNMKKENISSTKIKIIKNDILKKNNLLNMFDFIKSMNDNLERNKIKYQELTRKLFNITTQIISEQNNTDKDTEQIIEPTATEEKTKKIQQKTKKTKKNTTKPIKPKIKAQLSEITTLIELGQNNKDIKNKKDKKYKYSFYTSDETKYCHEPLYSGQYILCTRVEHNQGDFKLVNEDFFGISNDIIIMKLKDEYKKYYEQVFEYLKTNFNYKEFIEKDPVFIKKNNKNVKTAYIGLKHFKNFMIEL